LEVMGYFMEHFGGIPYILLYFFIPGSIIIAYMPGLIAVQQYKVHLNDMAGMLSYGGIRQ
ncbi:hypothetical protein SB717_36110, partial [Priestia sp. SIMBA_032]|uniref:hypothetical protein n=1 Tax=Priestia sp. SIMBA_032 TaxID=3085775 RepID=UPI00397DE778